MKSLILVTFGALGWSWYAMSGGADFEPGNRHVNLPGLQVETAQAATPEVARADTGAVDMTSVAAVSSAPAKSGAATEQAPKDSDFGVTLASAAGSMSSQTAPTEGVELASLDTRTDAAMTTNTTPAISEPTVDMRKVTGNLVNMRMGPGTKFQVLEQLRRGAEVKVLTDPGDGWVRLKTQDTNRIGWMSDDFLKTAAN